MIEACRTTQSDSATDTTSIDSKKRYAMKDAWSWLARVLVVPVALLALLTPQAAAAQPVSIQGCQGANVQFTFHMASGYTHYVCDGYYAVEGLATERWSGAWSGWYTHQWGNQVKTVYFCDGEYNFFYYYVYTLYLSPTRTSWC
jgi:hypothetical protein